MPLIAASWQHKAQQGFPKSGTGLWDAAVTCVTVQVAGEG